MEELMEHMQKHQKELADALALANYCQAVWARQICDGQGEGGAGMWVFKFGDCCWNLFWGFAALLMQYALNQLLLFH